MRSSASWLSVALLSASAWLLAPEAHALTAASPRVFPIDSGRCYRSPDITFERDSYFVAFAVAPCSGGGEYEVKVVRFDRSFATTGEHTLYRGMVSGTVPPTPLVSVSSAFGTVLVAATLRGAGAAPIRAFAVPSAGMLRTASMQEVTSETNVAALSVDCQALDSMAPCVLATIEEAILGSRAHVRIVLETARNAGPTSLIMGQNVTAIAAIGGRASDRGAVMTTDFIGSSAFFGPTSGVFADIERRSPLTLLTRGVAALRTPTGVVGFWSQRNELTLATGPNWGSLTYSRIALLAQSAAFAIDDAAAIGRTFALVGRSTEDPSRVANAPYSLVSLGTGFAPPLGAASITQPMVGDARIATSTLCPDLGTAAAVFSTTLGSPPSSGLAIVRYQCSADTECADAVGNNGVCQSGACVFRTGPCAADSGVPSLVDASVSDANPTIPPFDAEAPDAQAPIDASVDGVSSDSAGRTDANGQPSVRRVEYWGGACQCRAAAVSPRAPRGVHALASLAFVAAVLRRRRRA
ncbi:MAG: hypothetical protein JNK05_27130 [Myxococcales bacterium]|nr:hypothetical protein [Myxococcales bacterium]